MRYLLAAVDAGSLRSAADRCGISQPALGQQVALLEEELDVVLLVRSRRGVRLTEAGEAVLPALRRLVRAEDDVRAAAMVSRGSFDGTVRLGSVSVTAELVVAPVLGQIRDVHPGLRFTVREGPSRAVEQEVASGDLDLGVITTPSGPPPAGVRRVPLLQAPVGVLVWEGHPWQGRGALTWADLTGIPVVAMRAGTVMAELLERHAPQAEVVARAESARTLRLLVAARTGVGVLAQLGSPASAAGVAWVPMADVPPAVISLVQRSDSQPSPAEVVVRRLVRERVSWLAQHEEMEPT